MRLTLLLLSASFALTSGCAPATQVPGAKAKYPITIEESADRRSVAEREWRRMLEAYQVAPTPPDLHRVTYTPRSLLGISGGLPILQPAQASAGDVITLRAGLRTFLDRWQTLIGTDPAALSLATDNQTGASHRLTYRQSNFPYQIASPYGELIAVLTREGRLTELDDRLIPTVEIPVTPQVTREEAARRVVGRSFNFSDISGQQQRMTISNPDEVQVKGLLILPIERADSIALHLAWEIEAGKGMSWTVYVDAINGEELKAIQNFAT